MFSRIPGFSNLEVIGCGAFSTVYRGLCDRTYHVVSLKVIDKFRSSDDVIQEEIIMHRSLDHPFLAHYYGSIDMPDKTIVVMEYVKGNTLLTAINDSGCINEADAQRMFCQLVSAVKYMHSRKLVHRDLKLENIIVNFRKHVKLIDFGFTASTQNPTTTPCASIPYAAPEILRGEPFTEKVDVWALGVILYAMLAGELPFGDGDANTVSECISKKELFYPGHLSDEVVELLGLLLEKDVDARPTIDQIANHVWLQQTKSATLMNLDKILAPDLMVVPTGNRHIDAKASRDMQVAGYDVSPIDASYIRELDNKLTMAYRMFRCGDRENQVQSIVYSTLLGCPCVKVSITVPQIQRKKKGVICQPVMPLSVASGQRPTLNKLGQLTASRPINTSMRRRKRITTRLSVRMLTRTQPFLHQKTRRESNLLVPTMLPNE